MPAGKQDTNEDALHAMKRELQEETGFQLPKEQFKDLGTFYNRFYDYDFTFHLFLVLLDHKSHITINLEEHKGFLWVYPKDALLIRKKSPDST